MFKTEEVCGWILVLSSVIDIEGVFIKFMGGVIVLLVVPFPKSLILQV